MKEIYVDRQTDLSKIISSIGSSENHFFLVTFYRHISPRCETFEYSKRGLLFLLKHFTNDRFQTVEFIKIV